MSRTYLVLVICVAVCATDGNEIEQHFIQGGFLTSEEFDHRIANKSHLVLFIANDCPECNNLFARWEQLVSRFNRSEDNRVAISMVNCSVEKKLCRDPFCRTVNTLNAIANPVPNAKCMMPFVYEGVSFEKCTQYQKSYQNDDFWCKTGEGDKEWGICNDNCWKESKPSQFVKIKDSYCQNEYGKADTMNEAIKVCEKNPTCKMFYNEGCNDVGPFRFCQNLSDIKNASSGSCIYVKKENPCGLFKGIPSDNAQSCCAEHCQECGRSFCDPAYV